MDMPKTESGETLESKAQSNPHNLIVFDENIGEIEEEFYSEYSSQIYNDEGSVISDETEKRKKEIREKFNQYLNNRKSQGLANIKRNTYN